MSSPSGFKPTIGSSIINIRTRTASTAALVSIALLGLSACGGSDEPKAEKPTSPSVSAPPSTPAESPTDAPVTSGDQPEWAKPSTEVGTKISSFKAGDISIDVFQVGTTKATKRGQFVNPDDNKPIIAEGAEIVFVNYVVTNNGEPIDLGSSFASVRARYNDWKYMQGMDSVVDSALFEQMKVNSNVLAPGAFKTPSVYTFGKGQTFSYGENFLYQKNSPIGFKATITPVDADGKLLHDKKLEGEGTGTIK